MIKNYAKIAVRNLAKYKTYSAINVFGLALGLTCCLLIFLYVQFELSFDRFHENADRVYRLGFKMNNNGRWSQSATQSWKAGEVVKTSFPEIENLVRIGRSWLTLSYADKEFLEKRIARAENGFFQIFSFPLLAGNKDTALDGPNKIVISDEMARKYFGDEDPMGKTLIVNKGLYELTVTGIIEKMPPNSHFHFDFLLSSETGRNRFSPQFFTNTGWTNQFIYFMLKEGTNPESLPAKFPALVKEHFNDNYSPDMFQLTMQPLKDIHLYSHTGEELEVNGNAGYVFLFSIVGIIILFTACINYMNLATARSLKRAREVGMRKVLGASKKQLMLQFLGESTIVTLAAFLISLTAVYLLLPTFNAFGGKEIELNFFSNLSGLGTLVFLMFFVGLVSGSYPALILSAFRPLHVAKGLIAGKGSGNFVRKGLVVVQFSIATVLIISTGIVLQQLDFLRNKNLGYNKNQLIYTNMVIQLGDKHDIIKNELLSHPDIEKVSFANLIMPGTLQTNTGYSAENVTIDPAFPKYMKQVIVDEDYFKTLEVEFVDGRDFSTEFASDSGGIILNESAVKQLGWEEPIGKWYRSTGMWVKKRSNVIGVVKDFNFESLHKEVSPIAFSFIPALTTKAYIKINGENIPSVIDHIKGIYSKFVPNFDFNFSFIDDNLNRLYESEEKFFILFSVFTFLAVIIACMGILGLVSFAAELRTKEIGVRKVLGASVASVLKLLVNEFTILIVAASFIAVPFAYTFAARWLDNFAYKASIHPGVFVMSVLLVVSVAVLTVLYQAFKAATVNPIISLRSE